MIQGTGLSVQSEILLFILFMTSVLNSFMFYSALGTSNNLCFGKNSENLNFVFLNFVVLTVVHCNLAPKPHACLLLL